MQFCDSLNTVLLKILLKISGFHIRSLPGVTEQQKVNWISARGLPGILSKFTNDKKLRGTADSPEDREAVQRDLNKSPAV